MWPDTEKTPVHYRRLFSRNRQGTVELHLQNNWKNRLGLETGIPRVVSTTLRKLQQDKIGLSKFGRGSGVLLSKPQQVPVMSGSARVNNIDLCTQEFCSEQTNQECQRCDARYCKLHAKLGFQCGPCDRWCCWKCSGPEILSCPDCCDWINFPWRL